MGGDNAAPATMKRSATSDSSAPVRCDTTLTNATNASALSTASAFAVIRQKSTASAVSKISHALWGDKKEEDDDEDEEEYVRVSTSRMSARPDWAMEDGSRSRMTSVFVDEPMKGLRGVLSRLIQNPNFDLLMGIVITANFFVMILEADTNAPCAKSPKDACYSPGLYIANYSFLAAYTMELGLRAFVQHCQVFFSPWNILDIFVVTGGFLDVVVNEVEDETLGQVGEGPSVSLLRIFRVLRLIRAVRIFHKVPELYVMLRGFISAMRSMFFGFMMILCILLLYSVLCVELVHPISLEIHRDNPFCLEAFGSVWHCLLMFFQTLVAGDSWGACALPIIKESVYTFVIFSSALIGTQLGFMNLILAVIVERAQKAADEDEQNARQEKLKMERKASLRLWKLFKEIDADESGSISLQELLEGFDTNQDMQNMFSKLDITRKELVHIFELMDTDNEGDLSYDYLIENLRMTQVDDTRKSLTMLRLQANEIARYCKRLQKGQVNLARGVTPTHQDEIEGPGVQKAATRAASNSELRVKFATAPADLGGIQKNSSSNSVQSSASAAPANDVEIVQFAPPSPKASVKLAPPVIGKASSPNPDGSQQKELPMASGGDWWRSPGPPDKMEQKLQPKQSHVIADVDRDMEALRSSLDEALFGIRACLIARFGDMGNDVQQGAPKEQQGSPWRLVTLINDKNLKIEAGPGFGEVSL